MDTGPASPAPTTHAYRWLPVVLAVATVVVGVGVKLSCLGPEGLTLGETALPWCYTDVSALFQERGLGSGVLPYRDVMTEYPPLTGLQWWLAAKAGNSVTSFYLATSAFQALAAGGVAWAVLALRTGRDRALLVSLAPALLLSATINWDMVPVALLCAALVAHDRRRPVLTGGLLALGGLAKLFPLVALPVLAWQRWRDGQQRQAIVMVAVAGLTVVAVQVPVVLFAPEGWDAWVSLNSTRVVDWDTLWYANAVLTQGALDVALSNRLVSLTLVGGWACILLWSRRRVGPWLVLPLLAWLLLAGKVYSPQFSLWLIPLLALSRIRSGWIVAWLVADAAVILTRFPFLAGQRGLTPALPYAPFGIALAIRGALLLYIIIAEVRRLGDGVDASVGADMQLGAV